MDRTLETDRRVRFVVGKLGTSSGSWESCRESCRECRREKVGTILLGCHYGNCRNKRGTEACHMFLPAQFTSTYRSANRDAPDACLRSWKKRSRLDAGLKNGFHLFRGLPGTLHFTLPARTPRSGVASVTHRAFVPSDFVYQSVPLSAPAAIIVTRRISPKPSSWCTPRVVLASAGTFA